MHFDRVGEVLCRVGESPLWSPAERLLHWVDIEGRRVYRSGPAPDEQACWSLPERPACLALHAGGGLVCALESSVVRLTLQADGMSSMAAMAAVQHPAEGMRFNDGRCDRHGAFWVTSMVMNMGLASPLGQLFRLGRQGFAVVDVPPLVVPNGLAFSPDGRFLYLSDSHATVRRIWRFAHDPDDGRLGPAALFVDMNLHPGRPDGAAVDTDGCYWTCANDAGLLHRFRPDGRLDRSIAVPMMKPSMCAFGGAHLDELYITSIRPQQPDLADAVWAGATVVCKPGQQGLPEHPWGVPAAGT
ncbi:MAG: SMP-30/gluconolactonase/LRE family protein [Pseudomonadota bacterium]|nr:SMP-30/gluconolactonase/LRE family protein [Pseudomonadota bacterium]